MNHTGNSVKINTALNQNEYSRECTSSEPRGSCWPHCEVLNISPNALRLSIVAPSTQWFKVSILLQDDFAKKKKNRVSEHPAPLLAARPALHRCKAAQPTAILPSET